MSMTRSGFPLTREIAIEGGPPVTIHGTESAVTVAIHSNTPGARSRVRPPNLPIRSPQP